MRGDGPCATSPSRSRSKRKTALTRGRRVPFALAPWARATAKPIEGSRAVQPGRDLFTAGHSCRRRLLPVPTSPPTGLVGGSDHDRVWPPAVARADVQPGARLLSHGVKELTALSRPLSARQIRW